MTTIHKDFPICLISFFNVDFGIRYVSAFLKSKGYPTKFISFQQQRLPLSILENDYFVNPVFNHNLFPSRDIELLGKLIKDINPRLVGLSLASGSFRTAQAVTSEIRKNTQAPVVWGGIHPTLAPEECIPFADVVCVGEGEFPMWELAEKMRLKEPATKIQNLWIKKENGIIEKNDLRPLIADLDSLPFADFVNDENKFLIDSGKIYKDLQVHSAGNAGAFPMMASRGCMFSCSYCCNSVFRKKFEGLGSYLRRRSVKNIIEELRAVLSTETVSAVKFWDDVFTYDEAWAKEFNDVYVKEVGKSFGCYGHPKHSSRAILNLFANAGLVEVNVGIQSGSERISQGPMNRTQKNCDIIDFANFLQDSNIQARFDIITDNPIETDEDHGKGVDLLLELPHPYNVLLFSMCYFPKTPMTEEFLKNGIIREDDVETRTSKSINNFHTFLPFSRTEKDLFWNCLTAMAVSNAFPKPFIRFCKKNKFFRKQPKLLVFLLSVYMRVRYYIRFKILLQKRYFLTIFKNYEPRFFPIELYTYLQGYRVLSTHWAIDHSLLPKGQNGSLLSENDKPRFCLKIKRRKIYVDIFKIRVIFEANEFRVRKIKSKVAWAVDLPYKLPPETTIDIELAYPNLIINMNGKKQVLSPFCNQMDGLKKDTLYVLKLKLALPFNLMPNIVNHVLFYA
jgi:radical SAM superfamily enzyme YgiQ (UPF0313 family)